MIALLTSTATQTRSLLECSRNGLSPLAIWIKPSTSCKDSTPIAHDSSVTPPGRSGPDRLTEISIALFKAAQGSGSANRSPGTLLLLLGASPPEQGFRVIRRTARRTSAYHPPARESRLTPERRHRRISGEIQRPASGHWRRPCPGRSGPD